MGSIMRSMGGGGHPGAGAAMLKSVNHDAVEEWIRELILGNQQSSVQISDLMSFPVVTVTSDTTMKDVYSILREKGCTGFPVIENDKLVGIISRRDFRKKEKIAVKGAGKSVYEHKYSDNKTGNKSHKGGPHDGKA